MVSLNELGSMAILIVIAAIAISIGASLESSIAENNLCVGTWFTGTGNTTARSPAPLTNPVGGSWSGCCTTVNSTAEGNYCMTWYTSSIALNTTYNGLEASKTLGQWLPIIAIVVAAVVVIGLLVMYLGGLGSRM